MGTKNFSISTQSDGRRSAGHYNINKIIRQGIDDQYPLPAGATVRGREYNSVPPDDNSMIRIRE
jgi:hypothetical protein